MTIRNVVMGRLAEDASEADREQLARGLDGILALDLPGMLANRLGTDLGLREGGWDFAITNDWTDAEAYRAYDVDDEHNRARALIVGVAAQIARVQFTLD